MVNIKSPIFIVIIGVVAILAIVSAFGISYLMYEMAPPKIVNVTAKFSGDQGDMIIVHYQLDKPAVKAMSTEETYLMVDGTNRTIGPLVVTKIGVLHSQGVGKTMGWFVADNGEFQIVNGTNITIVLGGEKFENYTMIYDPNNLGIV